MDNWKVYLNCFGETKMVDLKPGMIVYLDKIDIDHTWIVFPNKYNILCIVSFSDKYVWNPLNENYLKRIVGIRDLCDGSCIDSGKFLYKKEVVLTKDEISNMINVPKEFITIVD